MGGTASRPQAGSISLGDYMRLVEPTDKMPSDLHPVLLGLYGEVGSAMATSKKQHRERGDYVGFRRAAVEELGDVLWYFAAVGRRLKIPIDSVFAAAAEDPNHESSVVASDLLGWPVAIAKKATPTPDLDPALLRLGEHAAALLHLGTETKNAKELLCSFAASYIKALQASGATFAEIASSNAVKTRGRFLEVDCSTLPTFDEAFEEEERIPPHFEIQFTQRKSGKSYLQWHGVFLGDPLTDNIQESDGYRFHDVFHLAHAAVLHWSPVFRALIKHKRKSVPKIDEVQDGGRAVAIEEGLTAWMFSQAKENGYFAGRKSISFDILKAIENFVAGYEVDQCPLKLWEDAILQGYDAFLKVRDNNGGIVVGDRETRTLIYKLREPDNKGQMS